MPVINFKYSDLCTMLGEQVPEETLVERIPMIGADMGDTEGGSDDMSVEFFPNRPDLYSVEGVARALRAFLGIMPGMKSYPVAESDVEVFVDPKVEGVRPWFLCGIVRDVEVTDEFLRSLMELQEKLHITIGRKRSKLAIGIHDLSAVEPPFTYTLKEPRSVRFVPLAMDEEMDLSEILERNEKGREYSALLDGMDEYPVILDSEGRVLSFPPIINGSLTTVTVGHHDLFIDVTGSDRRAVKGALDIVAAALAERGGRIESVVMHYGDGSFRSPDLSPSKRTISSAACDRFLGRAIGPEGDAEALRRMGMDAVVDGDSIEVTVPAYRLDIMHDVDIYEDVGIGYGFERFGGPYEVRQTPGGLLPETAFSESVRDVMIGLGFTEVCTLTLSNQRDEFATSGLPEMDVVRVLNPITEDHTCLRANLAPSLVRILRHNKHRDLPQRIFEIGYVVRDGRTVLHLCAMATASRVPFTEVKSWTESFLREAGLQYSLESCGLRTFVPGRGAAVVCDGRTIGMFGEMAPQVVVDFGITHPVGFFEIDLNPIVAGKSGTLFRGGCDGGWRQVPGFQPERRERRDVRQLDARGRPLRDILLSEGRHPRVHEGGCGFQRKLRPVHAQEHPCHRSEQGLRSIAQEVHRRQPAEGQAPQRSGPRPHGEGRGMGPQGVLRQGDRRSDTLDVPRRKGRESGGGLAQRQGSRPRGEGTGHRALARQGFAASCRAISAPRRRPR